MTAAWTTEQAQACLGIRGTQFWRVIWKAFDSKQVFPIRWGARCYRFNAAEIERLRDAHMIRTRADLAQAVDGRRRWNKKRPS